VSEQPLLAERQLLPAQSCGDRGFGVADVGKTCPQIERTAERRRCRTDFLVSDARILQVRLK